MTIRAAAAPPGGNPSAKCSHRQEEPDQLVHDRALSAPLTGEPQ
jgi:hypothetical protein